MPFPSPPAVRKVEYQDISQYSDAVGWDLDFRQLEPGILKARATMLAGQGCMVMQVDFNRSLHQIGNPPDDQLTFGLPGSGMGEFRWCNRAAKGGSLLNFNLDAGYDSITPSYFCGHTISFEKAKLRELGDRIDLPVSVDKLISERAVVNSTGSRRLGRQLEWLFNQSLDRQRLRNEQSEFLNDEIGTKILEILSGEPDRRTSPSCELRRRVIEQSLSYLEDARHLPITIGELCRVTSSSRSTLQRAFLSEFGVSPKAYVRARCLSAVRDQLAKSSPGTSIAEVANRWGFWHMGQFARDYKDMIGELPNVTLKRR